MPSSDEKCSTANIWHIKHTAHNSRQMSAAYIPKNPPFMHKRYIPLIHPITDNTITGRIFFSISPQVPAKTFLRSEFFPVHRQLSPALPDAATPLGYMLIPYCCNDIAVHNTQPHIIPPVIGHFVLNPYSSNLTSCFTFLFANRCTTIITITRNAAPTKERLALNVNVPTFWEPLVCATKAVPQIKAASSKIKLPLIFFTASSFLHFFLF